MFRRNSLEMRALILAPIGRDASLLATTLASLQIESVIASDALMLLRMIDEGVGLVIASEEALNGSLVHGLTEWLASQPPWSDLPFLVLTSGGRPTYESHRKSQELQALGNVSLIERPARPETLLTSARAALRGRMRQYEIRSRQEALLQANADLEQFAHSASHDLKEPLRSIGIYADLLELNYSPRVEDKDRECIAAIQSGVSRMDALLAGLLSYAHASSIVDGSLEPVQAINPLHTALETLAVAIRESGAQISIGEMPIVRMHESHLSQVFQNVIGNAIKYRREECPPLIQISASKSGTHWTFRIADNGIGVPAEYREAIFGMFKRLHSNSKYSGTGMGLAICQRIIERYQGRIWVESEVDQGSTFFFSIPA